MSTVASVYNITDLRFSYGKHFSLLLDQFTVKQGQIIGMVGLNGQGKSTLLQILAFLLKPPVGKIEYFGELVTRNNIDNLRQTVALLLQETTLLKRSVFENVAYGLIIRGFNKEHIEEMVAKTLARVGLSIANHGKKQSHELSGGEMKRVALAARIAISPQVLLLDEPTTSIDKLNKDIIYQTLVELNQEKQTTIIVSSHDESWLSKFTTAQIEL